MTVSLLVAMDRNNGIGVDNRLPWRLPADLAYFRRLTTGHTVLMGRRTFESIGKPLPKRRNVIITRDAGYRAEGCEVMHDIGAALARFGGSDELFVIGGAEIFAAVMPAADKLYITRIDHEFQVDTYFPAMNEREWRLVSSEPGVKDENNPYDYVFLVFERAGDRA